MARKHTRDGLDVLLERFVDNDPELAALIAKEDREADIAQQIYDLRVAAGLTQRQLATLIGSDAAVISRLESANYQGHSVRMLNRIADALGKDLHIEFRDRTAVADVDQESDDDTAQATSCTQVATIAGHIVSGVNAVGDVVISFGVCDVSQRAEEFVWIGHQGASASSGNVGASLVGAGNGRTPTRPRAAPAGHWATC